MAKQRIKKAISWLVSMIQKAPFMSFIVLLIILFAIIFVSNTLRAPEVGDDEMQAPQKRVHVIKSDDARVFRSSGQVEQESVVAVNALASGIVQRIHVDSGQEVSRGTKLITMSETYSGSNSAWTAQKIADRNVLYQQQTFEKSEGIADDQRDDVSKTGSLEEEIARKQFTLQKRGFELQRDLANLDKERSSIALERYNPSAWDAGSIERIFVRPGQNVNPGDPLMILNTNSKQSRITVTLSQELARSLSDKTPAKIMDKDGKMIEAYPQYISKIPTDNQSYSVIFIIPNDSELMHDSYVDVEFTIEDQVNGYALVPLDTIQLTNDGAFIFVVEEGMAVSREVILGEVFGSYVKVMEGLQTADQVIRERTVSQGDRVVIVD